MCFYSIKKKDYICHNDYWYQNIPNADIINFLIPHVLCLVSVCSCCLHPRHTLCQGVLYNWTHYAGVLLLTLQLAGTSAGCAGTMLLANINTARTSKAGSLGRTTWACWLQCTAVSPDLGMERVLLCQARRHYIQDVLNRLATRLYSDGNAAWKQCLKIFFTHIFCLKRCSTHFGGSINLDPFMQNYNATLSNSDTGLTIYIRSFDTPS